MSDTALMTMAPVTGGSPFTDPILVERDDLVEVESRERKKVPNYFIDTQIFNKMGRNAFVEAQPSVVHFAGFTVGQVHVRKVKFVNVSSEVMRFHILAPETSFFKLIYQKKDRLVPGFAVECKLEFRPTETRYYYDALRIHSKDDSNNLIIPVHAYPVLGFDDFPQQIKFPVIPVGNHKTKIIPLRSRALVDFEFTIKLVTESSVFTVDPLEGIIPAQGEIDIGITFTPSDFVTAEMTFELNISQFNFKPVRCHVMGYSAPGLERQEVYHKRGVTECSDPGLLNTIDLRAISPLDRARSNKSKAKIRATLQSQSHQTRKSQLSFPEQERKPGVEMQGIYIPPDLNCPFNVGKVLTQKKGKMSIKQLRDAMEKSESGLAASRQMKEAVFDQEIRQDVYEERQNQLRWQVKLGDNPLTEEEMDSVLEDRLNTWNFYKSKRGDPDIEEELSRPETLVTFRRTRRIANEQPQVNPMFDLYKNDLWESRWACRFRFAQAAWKVIMRKRADEKIASLRQLILDWGKGKYAAFTTAEIEKKEEVELEEEEVLRANLLGSDTVGTISFPTHQSPQQIKKMEEAIPPKFEPQPTQIVIKRSYNYHNLQVPQQYSIQHYSKVDIHTLSSGHVPIKTMRPLRQGAVDEVIEVPLAAVITDDYKVEELGELEQEAMASDLNVNLKPPAALFQPITYHPLHIFNPAPGLRVFEQPPPYLETDIDFNLCPLPRYGSQTFLDRKHIIKGVTTWKKFASPGLSTLSNTPTLTSVWVPRWTDPFNKELLPTEVPSLLEGLDEEDAAQIVDDDEGEEIEVLTPEMVNAEFIDSRVQDPDSLPDEPKSDTLEKDMFPFGTKMPSSNIPLCEDGLVPRWDREQDLDYFLVQRSNKLGQKVALRTRKMNSLLNNKDLILK